MTARLPNFALIVMAVVSLHFAPAAAAVHTDGLDDALKTTPSDKTIPVILMLDQRLTMEDVYPVALTLPMNSRRTYVVNALKDRFKIMGSDVMAFLESEKAEGRVSILRPLWILNAIRAHVTPDVIRTLDQEFPEVVYALHDPKHENTLDGIGWGVENLRAPEVWSDFADGSGVILAHKDSGCDYFLPGFQGHIWDNLGEDFNDDGNLDESDENNVDDDGNGYIDDFHGWGFDLDNANNTDDDPDASGHGTRTASVISSEFTPNNPCDTTSVAPGAKLMVLRGFWYQGSVFESSQYAMEMGANVISASVSFKMADCISAVRDCPNHVCHRMVSEMELAAGMIHANSTGNQGNPGEVPLNIPVPANSPPPAMTDGHPQQGGVSSIVAVAGYNSNGTHYGPSGRGPAGWSREDICVQPRMAFCGPAGLPSEYPAEYEDYPYQGGEFNGLAKPDFASPTSVPAYARGGGCSSISGTSGATPHVGGVLALIYSAFPGITPESAYRLLVSSADDQGDPGWDPLWGFGKIRPYEAAALGSGLRGVVTGLVDDPNDNPVADARISAGESRFTYSNSQGRYYLSLEPGEHDLLIEKYGYNDVLSDVTVAAGDTVTLDGFMMPAQIASLTISVTGAGQPLPGMPIRIAEANAEYFTNGDGVATFDIYHGRYLVDVGALPWETVTLTVNVQGSGQLGSGLVRSVQAQPTGPDGYGYYVQDMYDRDDLVYDWIDIEGIGQTCTAAQDGNCLVTLPFEFPFYGVSYTQLRMHANGFLVFGNVTSDEYGPWPIPQSTPPNNYLAPFFNDWEPQSGGEVLYYNDLENHRMVFQWSDVPDYAGTGPASFQCILYDPDFDLWPTEDGVAVYQYGPLTGRYEGSVGMENANGSTGIEYQFQLHNPETAVPIEEGLALMVTTEVMEVVGNSPTQIAAQFELHPNFPNPFNASTTFSFAVPHRSHVKLALYDLLGRQSAVVYDQIANSGEIAVPFDASALASGLYFARLESAGKTVGLQKVMLLK